MEIISLGRVCTAGHYAIMAYAVAQCLSMTRQYCIKTDEHIVMQYVQHSSVGIH